MAHSQLTGTCTHVAERTVLEWCREGLLQSVYQRALSLCDRRASHTYTVIVLSVVAVLRIRDTLHKSVGILLY